MFIMNYCYTRVPIYMKNILNEVRAENRPHIIFEETAYALFFSAFTAYCMFQMRQLIIGASRHIEYKLRKELFNKLIYQDFSFFAKNKTGDLISRCTNDLDQVRVLLGPGIMYLPNSISRLILFAPILISLNFKLSVALFILITILILMIIFIMPLTKPLHKAIQEHIGSINDRVWQVLSGIHTIKLYTRERIEEKRFKSLNREYIKRNMKSEAVQAFLWPFFMTLFGATELLIIGIGGREVILGNMSLGELLQFKVMIAILAFPVLSLGWVMSVLQQGISAMERIELILNSKQEKQVDAGKQVKPDNAHIELKNLNFNYPDHEQATLKNINLSIQPGEVVGITGPVGSGKSTLISLITGTLQPKRGELFIGGVDVLDIAPEDHYSLFAYVPQNTFLFSNTIENNVALYHLDASNEIKEDDRKLVEKVSKLAALDKDVQTFKNDYREVVGEKGVTLSGGQKQRVSIARALFKNVELLIFDDALSAVDADTEKEILDHIKQLSLTHSMIIVSHRISSMRFTDRVYYLDKGSIAEHGSHEELLQHGGHYANIAKLQQLKNEVQA